MTTTLAPGSTFAVLTTAPTPVMTEQPTRLALVERHVLAHRDRPRFGDHRVLGKGGHAGEVMDVLAVAVQPDRAVEEEPARGVGAVAKDRPPADAVVAPAAVRPEVEDDRLARLDLVQPGPTRSTTPAASWPSTMGSGIVHSPFITW